MKVFVAGATGLIGRTIVPRVVKAGHDVVGGLAEGLMDQLKLEF